MALRREMASVDALYAQFVPPHAKRCGLRGARGKMGLAITLPIFRALLLKLDPHMRRPLCDGTLTEHITKGNWKGAFSKGRPVFKCRGWEVQLHIILYHIFVDDLNRLRAESKRDGVSRVLCHIHTPKCNCGNPIIRSGDRRAKTVDRT